MLCAAQAKNAENGGIFAVLRFGDVFMLQIRKYAEMKKFATIKQAKKRIISSTQQPPIKQ